MNIGVKNGLRGERLQALLVMGIGVIEGVILNKLN